VPRAQTSPLRPLGLISIFETPRHSTPRFIKPHRHHSKTCCDSITAVSPRPRHSPHLTVVGPHDLKICCSAPTSLDYNIVFPSEKSNNSRQPATVHSGLVAQGLSLIGISNTLTATNPIPRRIKQSTRTWVQRLEVADPYKYILGEPL